MSDSVRARLGQQVVEYDWIQATINFTKLCGQKCNVFKGEDDTLDSKEANCLSKFHSL